MPRKFLAGLSEIDTAGGRATGNWRWLQLILFKDIEFWDAAGYIQLQNETPHKYSLIRLKEVIKQRREFIRIDDNTEYKRCKVQLYAKGIELRDLIKGIDIKTKKQQVCRTNEFLVAEIDAKFGGYGIVPKSLEGAIASNHYFLYEINQAKLLPEFLGLYIKTAEFHHQIQAVGSTNYAAIRSYYVLEYTIPLPPLAIQQELVSAYKDRIQQAIEAEAKADKMETEIEQYLLKELGIENQETERTKKKGLQLVNFKDIARWDIWNIRQQFLNTKYPLTQLYNLIKMSSGQFLPKKSQIEGIYLVYGGNGVTGNHNQFIYEGKRLVIGRVGEKCGNVHLVEGQYWITDNAFKVDKISQDVTYEYLEVAIKALNLNQFRILSAQPSISQSIVLDLKIPLPPLSVQTDIVSHINEQKAESKRLRDEAERLRTEAKTAFENGIFEQ